MSFNAIVHATAGTLAVTNPPRVMSRHQEGPTARGVAVSLQNTPIVTEWTGTQNEVRLVLRFELLTATEIATLRAIMNAAGTVTVKTHGAASGVTCLFAPASEQLLEPILGHYAEATSGGSAIATKLTRWRAEVTLIRI